MAGPEPTSTPEAAGSAGPPHRWHLSGPLWAKLLAGFGVAGLVAVVVLRLSRAATRVVPTVPGDVAPPPVSLLLGVGLVVAVLTTGAVYWGVRSDLGLPARTAIYAVGYNAFVVAAKFVLAPWGIYELNRTVTFETFFPFTEPGGAVATAIGLLLVYLGVFTLIYRRFRRQVVSRERRRLRDWARRRVILLVVGAVLFTTGVTTIGAVLALVVGGSGLTYLGYVFSSVASLLVALAVAGATSLAVLAFADVRDRIRVVGDASVIVGFFWLGLFVLVLYHALWVVFILVLTALWPLKVVVPK